MFDREEGTSALLKWLLLVTDLKSANDPWLGLLLVVFLKVGLLTVIVLLSSTILHADFTLLCLALGCNRDTRCREGQAAAASWHSATRHPLLGRNKFNELLATNLEQASVAELQATVAHTTAHNREIVQSCTQQAH